MSIQSKLDSWRNVSRFRCCAPANTANCFQSNSPKRVPA